MMSPQVGALRATIVCAVAVILLAATPVSGSTHSCNQDAQCQGQTIQCSTGEDCTVSCEANQACQSAQIIGPGGSFKLTVNCNLQDSCTDLQALTDFTTLNCNTGGTCTDAGVVECSNGLDPFTEQCVVLCQNPGACDGVDIQCPSNAGCDITCQSSGSCQGSTLTYAENRPFRVGGDGGGTASGVCSWCGEYTCSYPEWQCAPGICESNSEDCEARIPATPAPTPVVTQQPTPPPTRTPTAAPTAAPTAVPTSQPTAVPTSQPTAVPTAFPTGEPTGTPTSVPTVEPTARPTPVPTRAPTAQPTEVPTPLHTRQPTGVPTSSPTAQPSGVPSPSPTFQPTGAPTPSPTFQPTGIPTPLPTSQPTGVPTPLPTFQPTGVPSPSPTSQPTDAPTDTPTVTSNPTAAPNVTAAPAVEATVGPVVLEARFNAVGTAVQVDFSAETNGRLMFPSLSSLNCEEVFESISLPLLGSSAECQFTSATHLVVQVFADALLVPQEIDSSQGVLSIRDGAFSGLTRSDVLNANEAPQFVARETFTVLSPQEPVLPRAVVQGPARVGPCEASSVTLSAARSTGLAGRAATYAWNSSNCASTFLGDPTNQILTVDMSQIPARTECEYSLQVTNFLEVASVFQSVTILRAATAQPNVELVSNVPSPWTRNQAHTVSALVTVPSCSDEDTPQVIDPSSIAFAWEVYDDRSNRVAIEDSNLHVATIRSFQLEVNHFYTFEVTISDPSSGSFEPFSSSLVIEVGHAQLSAVISEYADVLEHYVANDLLLDASKSMDENFMQVGDLPEGHFDYAWRCEVADHNGANLESFVGAEFPDSVWSECDLSSLTTQAEETLQIVAGTMEPAFLYRFTVEVSTEDGRQSNDRVYVFPIEQQIPQVSIFVENDVILEFFTLKLEGRVAQGSVSDSSQLTYQWSEQNFDTLANMNDISPYLGTSVTGLAGPNLVLLPGLLQAGREYAFRLSVTDRITGVSGNSMAFVRVTSGPVITSFTAELLDRSDDDVSNTDDDVTNRVDDVTRSGVELIDVYRLSVAAYFPLSAASGELTYRFGYYVDDAEDEQVLTSAQILPYANVRLPAGSLSVVVHVSYGSLSTTDTRPLTVSPYDGSTDADACAAAQSSLQAAVDSRSINAFFQIATIYSSMLHDASLVSSCATNVQGERNRLYDLIPTVWSFQTLHSLDQIQQLAQLIESLSAPVEMFTLRQISTTLTWVDTIFDAAEESIAEGLTSTGVRFAEAIANIVSNSLSAASLRDSDTTVVGSPDSDSDSGSDTLGKVDSDLMQVDSDLMQVDSDSSGANEELFCEVVTRIRAQLIRLLQSEVADLLLNEDAVSLEAGNFVSRAIRAASGEGARIEAENSEITIVVSAESSTVPASVSFSSYDPIVEACFQSTDSSQTLAGPIIDIDVLECELLDVPSGSGGADGDEPCEFTVDNVTFGLSYNTDAAAQLESGCVSDLENTYRTELLQCSYWDEDEKVYRTDGCETVSVDEATNTVQCMCTHLTTFAVVRSFRLVQDNACGSAHVFIFTEAVAFVYMIAYGSVAGATIYQVFRVAQFTRTSRTRVKRAALTHMLIFAVCVAQALVLASLVWIGSRLLLEVASAVQLTLHFGIFAIVANQWASLYHGILPRENKVRDFMIKHMFMGGAAIVGLALLASVVIMAVTDASSTVFATAAFTGSIIITLVSAVSAFLFAVYGSLLVRKVMETYKNVKDRVSSGSARDSMQQAANRIFRFMLVLTCSFIAESVVNLIAITNEATFRDNFTLIHSLYLTLNLISIAAILVLFAKLVSAAEEAYRTHVQSLYYGRDSKRPGGSVSSQNGSRFSDTDEGWRSHARNEFDSSRASRASFSNSIPRHSGATPIPGSRTYSTSTNVRVASRRCVFSDAHHGHHTKRVASISSPQLSSLSTTAVPSSSLPPQRSHMQPVSTQSELSSFPSMAVASSGPTAMEHSSVAREAYQTVPTQSPAVSRHTTLQRPRTGPVSPHFHGHAADNIRASSPYQLNDFRSKELSSSASRTASASISRSRTTGSPEGSPAPLIRKQLTTGAHIRRFHPPPGRAPPPPPGKALPSITRNSSSPAIVHGYSPHENPGAFGHNV